MGRSNWVGAAIRSVVFAMVVVGTPAGFFSESAGAPKPLAQKAGAVVDSTAYASQIRELLSQQAAAWNRGDIDSFMTFYWRSDETLFVGANGITRGWQAVIDRYHRAYPDRKAMGLLTFSNLEVHPRCPDTAFVLGNFRLDRENDHPEGVFTLDLRQLPEGWRIVADHTTAFPAAQPAKSR